MLPGLFFASGGSNVIETFFAGEKDRLSSFVHYYQQRECDIATARPEYAMSMPRVNQYQSEYQKPPIDKQQQDVYSEKQ
jgi:hypothetical protein